jgi:hypothetical protein
VDRTEDDRTTSETRTEDVGWESVSNPRRVRL